MIYQEKDLPIYLTALVAQGEDLTMFVDKYSRIIDHVASEPPMMQKDTHKIVEHAIKANATTIIVVNCKEPALGVPQLLVSKSKRSRIHCKVFTP